MTKPSIMDMHVLRPIDRLTQCAQLWAEANGKSTTWLARAVVNDGGYFDRIAETGSTTTLTLERFARFLCNVGNWPEGAVPAEVIAFGHVTGVSAAEVRNHG